MKLNSCLAQSVHIFKYQMQKPYYYTVDYPDFPERIRPPADEPVEFASELCEFRVAFCVYLRAHLKALLYKLRNVIEVGMYISRVLSLGFRSIL